MDAFATTPLTNLIVILMIVIGLQIGAILKLFSDMRKDRREREEREQKRKEREAARDEEINLINARIDQNREATQGAMMRQMLDMLSAFPKAIKDFTESMQGSGAIMQTWMRQADLKFDLVNSNVVEGSKIVLAQTNHYGESISKQIDGVPAGVWSQSSAAQIIESLTAIKANEREIHLKQLSHEASLIEVDDSIEALTGKIDEQGKTIMDVIGKQQARIQELEKERDEAIARAEKAERELARLKAENGQKSAAADISPIKDVLSPTNATQS